MAERVGFEPTNTFGMLLTLQASASTTGHLSVNLILLKPHNGRIEPSCPRLRTLRRETLRRFCEPTNTG